MRLTGCRPSAGPGQVDRTVGGLLYRTRRRSGLATEFQNNLALRHVLAALKHIISLTAMYALSTLSLIIYNHT